MNEHIKHENQTQHECNNANECARQALKVFYIQVSVSKNKSLKLFLSLDGARLRRGVKREIFTFMP